MARFLPGLEWIGLLIISSVLEGYDCYSMSLIIFAVNK